MRERDIEAYLKRRVQELGGECEHILFHVQKRTLDLLAAAESTK